MNVSRIISNGFTSFIIQDGYLSKKKIKNMTPDELVENARLIDEEITTRGLGVLFG